MFNGDGSLGVDRSTLNIQHSTLKGSSYVTSAAFNEYLAALMACRDCPNVQGKPVTGAVAGARMMLVGQAPGPREVVAGRPFAFTAGKRLFAWFAARGVPEEQFRSRVHIAAVIRCFPGKDKTGGDRVPDEAEIARCGRHLDREIRILRPQLVIAVGALAARQFVGTAKLGEIVGRIHRVARAGRTFDTVVLPHPSGRSTWMNNSRNTALLERSLNLIVEHPAFAKTFGRRSRPTPPVRR
jgi:uracil-DNA glycosylase